MPTYLYESVPEREGDEPRRFEVRQSIREDALIVDPQTGRPVRRIITGGLGPLTTRRAVGPLAGAGHDAGAGCCGSC